MKLLHDYISERPVKDLMEAGSLEYLLEIIAPGIKYNELRNQILEEHGFKIAYKWQLSEKLILVLLIVISV